MSEQNEQNGSNDENKVNNSNTSLDSTTPSIASNFAILSNIFTSPVEGMQQIQHRYNVLFPLLTLIIATVVVFTYYYAAVDYQWYIDHMVEISAGELSKSEQDQTRAAFEMMSQSTMGSITTVTAAIGIVIFMIIQAVYFVIVSNITNDGFQFKQWLSFVAWSSQPALLVYVAMLAYIFFSSNGQIAFETLNPISLNDLFFNYDATQGVGKMLASLDLTKFWSMYIMIIGYQKWTNKSMANSASIVLIPFVAIYSIWAMLL
ncbi:MAG: YIP1 family protein [Kangiellaceae bacterium]